MEFSWRLFLLTLFVERNQKINAGNSKETEQKSNIAEKSFSQKSALNLFSPFLQKNEQKLSATEFTTTE